jgi:SpoVK/Ycf46/Vps4 family AAA+-type ATPase
MIERNKPVASADHIAPNLQGDGSALAACATKLDARPNWDDPALAPDTVAQLRELVRNVEQRGGAANKLAAAKGVTALFAGPSGTGRTLAAALVGSALGLDVYRVDLGAVVSKYIGETEKNLDRLFAAAQDARAVLFFDEADALFGKRSDVKDAHDRYANMEVAHLLRKLEDYDGLAIVACNRPDCLDEAVALRLTSAIRFPETG